MPVGTTLNAVRAHGPGNVIMKPHLFALCSLAVLLLGAGGALAQAEPTAPPAAAAPAAAAPTEPPPASPQVELEAPADLPPLPGAPPVETATEEPAATEPAPTQGLPPAERPRLLVMDLVDYGAGESVVNGINQAVQGQAIKSHVGEVVTAEQLRVTLDANALQQMVGCDTENCMATLGQRVDAKIVLGGNVSQVGADYLLTVVAVDPSTGAMLRTEQRKVAAYEDLYYYAARQLTSLALTGKTVDPTVPVRVDTNVPGGQLLVDGRDVGEVPMMVRLDPGTHELVVKADDYATWKLSVQVEDGKPLNLEAQLVEEGGFPLWPIAIILGGTSAVFALGGTIGGLHAMERHSGGPVPLISLVASLGAGSDGKSPLFSALGMPTPDFRTTHYTSPGQTTIEKSYQTQLILMLAVVSDIAFVCSFFFAALATGLIVTDVALWALEE